MRKSLHLLLLSFAALSLGCQSPPPPPAAPRPTGQRVETEDSCVDGWLSAKHLDSFGNPPDTNYIGGNPLLDEITGEKTDRFVYLYKKFPELQKLCRPTGK